MSHLAAFLGVSVLGAGCQHRPSAVIPPAPPATAILVALGLRLATERR